MARPKKDIDPELVAKLAAIHCTIDEIAAVCDCSAELIERRFRAELDKGRGRGKTQLRKGLWDLAARGNLGALIWLSKNHLGMSEKIEATNENIHLIEQAKELSKLPRQKLLAIARDEMNRVKAASREARSNDDET